MFPAIEELLPHRGRMRLVDRVLAHQGERISVELTVRDDPLFCHDGLVGSWVGIEYMAQSVAALVGLMSRAQGKPVRIGLLLGARRYMAHVPAFRAGQVLRVEASQVFFSDNGLAAFDARVMCDTDVLAEAVLSAFQPDDVKAFFGDFEA